MNTFTDVASERLHRINKLRNNQLVETASDSKNQAVPEWRGQFEPVLQPLVQNRFHAIRIARLLDEARDVVMAVARESAGKNNPLHWFNKCLSHASWENTKRYWREVRPKMHKLDRVAREVIQRVNDPEATMRKVRAIIKRVGESKAMLQAVKAQETARKGSSRFRFWCWLTSENRKLEERQDALLYARGS